MYSTVITPTTGVTPTIQSNFFYKSYRYFPGQGTKLQKFKKILHNN